LEFFLKVAANGRRLALIVDVKSAQLATAGKGILWVSDELCLK
jgi:hypothetical protein